MRESAALCLFLCVSCSAPPVRDFRVTAINSQEEKIPCVILVDDEIVLNSKTNQPVLTPAEISVHFKRTARGGDGYSHVKLGVRATPLGPDGNAIGGTETTEDLPYLEDFRYLQFTDSSEQVFALRPNRNAGQ